LILLVAVIVWIFISKNNNNIKFGPFEKEPNVFVSENSFLVVYEDNNQSFINVNDDIFGPYNKIVAQADSLSDKNFGFAYSIGPKNIWFVNINNSLKGPYEEAKCVSVSERGSSYAYKQNGQWYADINGKIYGPYEFIKNLASNDNYFIFSYIQDGREHILINGDEGPDYDSVESVAVNPIGVSYVYILSNEKFVNYSGKIFGPYTISAPIYLFENGFIFWYLDGQDLFINMNDVISGPYNAVNILKNSQYAAFYHKKSVDDYFYISTNTGTFGPYNYPYINGGVAPNKIGFTYSEKGYWYVTIFSVK